MALTQVQGGMILPSGQSIPSAALPVGSVLQVVNVFASGSISTTGGTYIDTGLTATITPKFSTSKILVLVSHGTQLKVGLADVMMRLVKNSTTLWEFGSDMINNSTSNNQYGTTASVNYLDSPATTSSVTYKTQFANGQPSGTAYGFIAGANITLMEIAG